MSTTAKCKSIVISHFDNFLNSADMSL